MTTPAITPADIETWARVEAAIRGKAIDLCAQDCGRRPDSPCTHCLATRDPAWRRTALRLIKGDAA